MIILSLFSRFAGAVQQAVIDPADTGWMLTATALVLIMTPGLAFLWRDGQ